MTTLKAMRLASLVTAINVLVASGFSIAAIIRPEYLLPVCIGGDLQTGNVCVADPWCARRHYAIAGFRNRSV